MSGRGRAVNGNGQRVGPGLLQVQTQDPVPVRVHPRPLLVDPRPHVREHGRDTPEVAIVRVVLGEVQQIGELGADAAVVGT
jgi:hypothetical protein